MPSKIGYTVLTWMLTRATKKPCIMHLAIGRFTRAKLMRFFLNDGYLGQSFRCHLSISTHGMC